MKKEIFRGSAPALVTPFTKNGVDFEAFKNFSDEELQLFTSLLERMQENLKSVPPLPDGKK